MLNIPIVINNFNRLSTTKKLVEDLQKRGYTNIHIIDNGSTYFPLHKWYMTTDVIIHYCTNLGSRAIYDCGLLTELSKDWDYVIYTDSDMVIPDSVPDNFIDKYIDVYNRYYPEYKKVGAALKIDDIPDHLPYKDIVISVESGYWNTTVEEDVYIAFVDTTFCLMSTKDPFDYKALRLGGKYTLVHEPWYIDPKNLSEEEDYFINTANTHSTHSSHIKNNK